MPPSEVFIRGAVGIGDRGANFHPEAWRRRVKMIELMAAPMLAITKSLGTEKTDSFRYNWAVHPFAKGRGSVTGVYTNAGLSAAYTSGGAVGDRLYIKMAEADAKQIIATDVITVIYDVSETYYPLYVEAVTIDGASSFVQGNLRTADASGDIANAKAANLNFTITGNAQEELSPLPTALFSEPTWFTNQVQNFMESTELSNREIKEKERIDPHVRVRQKLQAYRRLMRKKEWAYIFGKYDSQTGVNGKNITFTRGIYNAIAENEATNIFDFTSDAHAEIGTEFDGTNWIDQGMNFLNYVGEILRRKGEAPHKTCYAGGTAIRQINKACQNKSSYNIEKKETAWGIKIHTLYMPGQDWHIIEHPLFSENPDFRDVMLVTEKHLMKEKVFQPLKYIQPGQDRDGYTYVSGEKAGWECDTGLMYENLEAFGWIKKIGQNNAA